MDKLNSYVLIFNLLTEKSGIIMQFFEKILLINLVLDLNFILASNILFF